MRAAVLLNRGGGAVLANPAIADEVETALRESGIDPSVRLIAGGEFAGAVRDAVSRGDPLIIVGGGDGTIGAAASELAGSDTALGILPLGTLNHLARDLGIPITLNEAALVIARGQLRKIDLAEMNGQLFVNNSAIGLYPLMVLDRDLQRQRLGRSKRLALVVASARTLWRFGRQRLALTVNDAQGFIDTPLLFVGNNDYRLELPAAGRRDRLDDGRLCVMVMRKKTRRGLVAAAIRALVGRTRPDDMIRLDDVERLRVDSRRPFLAVSLDGEVRRLAPPLDYRIRPKALRVIVPAPSTSGDGHSSLSHSNRQSAG